MVHWTAVCEWDDRACVTRVDTHSQARKLAETMAQQKPGTPIYILRAVAEYRCYDATGVTMPRMGLPVMLPDSPFPALSEASFWMVLGLADTCRPPRHKHWTRDSAEAEALRLSRNNPGVTFAVLQATGSVVAGNVTYRSLR